MKNQKNKTNKFVLDNENGLSFNFKSKQKLNKEQLNNIIENNIKLKTLKNNSMTAKQKQLLESYIEKIVRKLLGEDNQSIK